MNAAFVAGFASGMIKEAPARSVAQQRFMGAELARARRGEKTETGMSIKQLRDFAGTPHKGLPEHVPQEEKTAEGGSEYAAPKTLAPALKSKDNGGVTQADMLHNHAPRSPGRKERFTKAFQGVPPKFLEATGGKDSLSTTENGTSRQGE